MFRDSPCIFHIFISWSYFGGYVTSVAIEHFLLKKNWLKFVPHLRKLSNHFIVEKGSIWILNIRDADFQRLISAHNFQAGDIFTLEGTSLKLVDKFTYRGNSVSSTEKDINTWLTKAWTAIDKLSIIWKSDLTDKMKHSFFQAAVMSILLYWCTTRTLAKQLEKKLDDNYSRILRVIRNKSWWQHPTKHQLYGHPPPIMKTIQVRRTRHAGHCWRSRDELISDVLLWASTYGRAKAGRPARTYIQQLCEDTGCSPEDLLKAMNDREDWRERVRDIRASGTTWRWMMMTTFKCLLQCI